MVRHTSAGFVLGSELNLDVRLVFADYDLPLVLAIASQLLLVGGNITRAAGRHRVERWPRGTASRGVCNLGQRLRSVGVVRVVMVTQKLLKCSMSGFVNYARRASTTVAKRTLPNGR